MAISASSISRNGQAFRQRPQLAEELAHAVRTHACVLDGEICCLEPDGRTHFTNLLFRREWPFFYAFDVLNIEGEDLTNQPLLERKRRLRRLMPIIDSRLLSLDHLEERGCDLFRVACERDLEGIVAKWAPGTYGTDGRATSWLKIKNPALLADARPPRALRAALVRVASAPHLVTPRSRASVMAR